MLNAITTYGVNKVNQPVKPMSAVKKYPRAKKKRGGETIMMHRVRSMEDAVLDANGIARDVKSGLARLLTHGHLTAKQAEAGRRYAYIVARFEKYSIEGRRTAKSPSYERAYGTDQELERLANEPDGIAEYEKRARKARKEYDKLVKVVTRFPGAKNVLDDLCCSDIEPPAQWRENVATVLNAVVLAFGITIEPRRNNRRGRN